MGAADEHRHKIRGPPEVAHQTCMSWLGGMRARSTGLTRARERFYRLSRWRPLLRERGQSHQWPERGVAQTPADSALGNSGSLGREVLQ